MEWPGACLSYTLSASASRNVSLAEAQILAAEAFGTWQSVVCPASGRHPSITVSSLGLSECARREYDRSGGNSNIVLFRGDAWPHPGAEDAVGLTTISSNERTGDILDADIEINGTAPLSSTDAVPPDRYDLLSVLTHEAGHFLGLAHSMAPGATMQPVFSPGNDYRVLTEDDIAGICAIYPPDRAAEPCDFTPHGGFSSECALGMLKGGCSAATPGVAPGAGAAGSALSFLLFLATRRSLRSRAPRRPQTSRPRPRTPRP